MSQLTIDRSTAGPRAITEAVAHTDWRRLMQTGGVAALLQIGCMIVSLVVGIAYGAEPETAAEAFAMLEANRITGILRLDFGTLVLICLLPITGMGVFAAMRRRLGYSVFMLVMVTIGTVLALANHSAFGIVGLADQYAAATDPVLRAQLLAAGEAVIANNMWHSTAGFVAGLFLQSGFAFISIIMLQGDQFSRLTGWTGLLSNGLDLVHVPLLLVAPTLSFWLLAVGGIFYVLWFPLLARDLFRLGRGTEAAAG